MKIVSITLVCVCVLALFSGCAEKSFLLTTQYNDAAPQAVAARDAALAELRKVNVPFHFNVFNMDMLGHPTEVWRYDTARWAVSKADAYGADLVLVAGDDAVQYFARPILGRPMKMVYFDVKGNPADYGVAGSDQITGVSESLPVDELFALMKRLVPAARGVAVLADNSLAGDAVVKRLNAAQGLPVRIVEIKRAGTLADWMAAVKDLQGKADALLIASYSSVLADARSTAAVPAADLLRMTSETNRLPDFAFDRNAVGPAGVLAAVYVPLEKQAEIAGRMAIDIAFYRVKPANIAPMVCEDRATEICVERATRLRVVIPADVLGAPAEPAAPVVP